MSRDATRLPRDRLPRDSHQRFYDRISRAYDLIADPAEHASREAAVELLAVEPGEAVLELGCGTGRALVDLAEGAGDAGRVLGIDVSAGMLAEAAKLLRERQPAADLLQADARRLPWREAAFDAVFMSFTLELFDAEDMARVLAETRRVLGPSGRLGVLAMAETGDDNPMTRIYSWFHHHFPHIVDCRAIPVEETLESAGFALRRRDDRKIFGLPVAAVVAVPES